MSKPGTGTRTDDAYDAAVKVTWHGTAPNHPEEQDLHNPLISHNSEEPKEEQLNQGYPLGFMHWRAQKSLNLQMWLKVRFRYLIDLPEY